MAVSNLCCMICVHAAWRSFLLTTHLHRMGVLQDAPQFPAAIQQSLVGRYVSTERHVWQLWRPPRWGEFGVCSADELSTANAQSSTWLALSDSPRLQSEAECSAQVMSNRMSQATERAP